MIFSTSYTVLSIAAYLQSSYTFHITRSSHHIQECSVSYKPLINTAVQMPYQPLPWLMCYMDWRFSFEIKKQWLTATFYDSKNYHQDRIFFTICDHFHFQVCHIWSEHWETCVHIINLCREVAANWKFWFSSTPKRGIPDLFENILIL